VGYGAPSIQPLVAGPSPALPHLSTPHTVRRAHDLIARVHLTQ
jgi:hypothetical protein